MNTIVVDFVECTVYGIRAQHHYIYTHETERLAEMDVDLTEADEFIEDVIHDPEMRERWDNLLRAVFTPNLEALLDEPITDGSDDGLPPFGYVGGANPVELGRIHPKINLDRVRVDDLDAESN